MKTRLPAVLLAISFFTVDLIAQRNTSNNIRLYLARSFHGTGDLSGINFTGEYGHFFSNKLELSCFITSTIHHGSFGLFITGPSGSFDGSLRYVTAGLQTGSTLGLALLSLRHHTIKIAGGAFVRYQSSSLPDQYSVTFPPAVNYPYPVFTFRHTERQNIFTPGYLAALSYTYTTKKDILLGIKAGFQNDTNGDVISDYGILIGKQLKFTK